MNIFKLIALDFLLLLLPTACSIMIKQRGVYNEYEATYQKEPALINCARQGEPCSRSYSTSCPITITSAKPLLTCIKASKGVVVYEWPYHCKGEFCYLLPVIQEWCKENEVELYVLAEYYNAYFMKQPYVLENPIVVIDHEYYGTKKVREHFKLFYQELIGRQRGKEEWGRLLYFKEGTFQGFYRDLKMVKPSDANAYLN